MRLKCLTAIQLFVWSVTSFIEVKVTDKNALKTIYSRIATLDQAKKVLGSVGVSIKDINGNVRPVSDILKDLSVKWKNLTDEQKQNIGVTVAGTYQLSRFLALMSNFSTATKATETSLTSQGSAMRENEKYLNSLTAKIEKLRTSFTQLSVSFGQHGLGQAFGFILESLTFLAQGFAEFTNATKGLNIIIPVLIGGIYGISKAIIALTAAARGLQMTPLGWITTAIGAIQLLGTVIMGTSKAFAENADTFVDAANKANDQANQLEGLIQKYQELAPQAKGNSDAQKELQNVLNQIRQIAPQVIEKTDEYGNSLSVNTDKAKQFVQSLREMNDEQLKNAKLKIDMDLSDAKNNLDALKQKAENMGEEVSKMYDKVFAYNKKYGVETYREAAEEYQKRTKNMSGEELRKAAQEYGEYILILTKHKKDLDDYRNMLQKVQEAENKVSDLENRKKQIDSLINSHRELNKVIQETFNNKIDKNVYGNLNDKQLQALIDFGKQVKNNTNNIDDYIHILKEAKIEEATIQKVVNALTTANLRNATSIDEMGISLNDLDQQLKDAKGDFNALADIMIQLAKQGQFDQAMVIATADAYQAVADKVAPLNELLEKMAEGKQISAAEAMELIQKEHELANAISIENGMVKVNADAVVKLRDTKVKSYEDMNKAVRQELINEANAIVRKIYGYKQEVMAIQSVADAKRKLAEMETDTKNAFDSGNIQMAIPMLGQIKQFESITENLEQLDQLSKLASQSLTQVGTSQEKLSESQDKANKSTEQSIYIADKYKQALEKVNTELEKINAIKSKFPQHSKEYQKALKQEIELLKQQKKIYEDQTKDLQRQIKSGKIQQTGIITQKSTSNSVYIGQYADIINKAAKTYGIDPFLIAAVIKQESNFNPRAKSHTGAEGLMQLTPTTAKELGVTNPYDPSQNIMGGAKYLAQQLQRFGGNIEKALAAYNAGAGNVLKYGGIPPFKETQNYVKKVSQYYSQYSKTGTIDTSDVSRQKAEAQQAIDEAKSQLLQIQGEIANIDAEIARVEVELINAQLAGFEYNKSNYDKIAESSEASLYKYKQTSAEYRKELERQRNAMANKAKENEKEIKFLQDLIKNGNLSAIALDEMKNKLHELQIEQKQTTAKTLELNKAIIDQVLLGYDNSQMRYDQFIEKSQIQLGRLTQGSEEYRTELEKQRETLRKKNEEQIKEQKYLQYAIRNFELAPEVVEEYKNKIHELGIEIEKTTDEQKKLGDAIAEDWIMQFKNQIDDVDYKIDISKSISIFYDEKSEEYNKEIEKQNALLEKRAKLLNEERQKILELMATEDLSVEKKKELAEAYENLSVEYLDTYNQIKQNSINLLESQEEKVIESIEKQKETTEKYYDSLIEAQQERLRLLDEEYEKEDRLQKLREINDEIQKVKNDKRFSYITPEGQEILTYDKARVTELEKERDELLKQYQREDIKKAIQDEIDQLEKAKREKIEILDKEIKATRQRYDELINTEKQKWVDLIKSVQNGTLTFDALMNSWYGSSFVSLKQYSINVQEEINKIKAAFESLAQKQIPNMPQNPNTSNQLSSQSPVYTNPDLSNAEKVKSTNGHYYYKMTNTDGTTSWVIDTSVQEKLKEGYTLQQYHDGGIVGGAKTKIQSLANKLFNEKLKPNETIVKSLVGELQIPPRNLPNIVHNIGNLVNSLIPKTPVVTTSGDTIHLHNVTIKADNPQQLFKELDLYIRMNRK